MNSDISGYMRPGVMQNPNEMNMYLTTMAGAGGSMPSSASMLATYSNAVQSQQNGPTANMLGARMQCMSINANRPSIAQMPARPASNGPSSNLSGLSSMVSMGAVSGSAYSPQLPNSYSGMVTGAHRVGSGRPLAGAGSGRMMVPPVTSSHGNSPATLSPSVTRRPMVVQQQDDSAAGYNYQPSHSVAMSSGGVNSSESTTGSNPGPKALPTSTYFYSTINLENTKKLQESNSLQSPSWIIYPPAPATATHLRTGRQHLVNSSGRTGPDKYTSSFFIDPELRTMLLNRMRACLLAPDDTMQSKLPQKVGEYEDLTPMESLSQIRQSVTLNLPSQCFKAWCPRDSRVVVLRRLPGVTAPTADAVSLLRQLVDVRHPNLIPVRDMFSTRAFNDLSLVFAFDYHPCSVTLLQTHMSDPMKLNGFASPFNVDRVSRPHSSTKNTAEMNLLPETTAWSYLIQLIQVVRFVHQCLGRCCRIIDPSKVLVQDGQRIRLNCYGLLDLLEFRSQKSDLETAEEISRCQVEDLYNLGRLALCVCCGTAVAVQESQLPTSLDLVAKGYRPELSGLIQGLLHRQLTSLEEVVAATAAQCYDHLQTVYSNNDFLERQLLREMECGRLFRLSCKLQTICERNELGAERDWSEMEDRYMLKLFRDFVFHQTDHTGAPCLDLAHIVSCLNKLDAGSSEKVCLVSRDGLNVLIVTYAEVRKWLDDSFGYLLDRQQRRMREQRQQQQLATHYPPDSGVGCQQQTAQTYPPNTQ